MSKKILGNAGIFLGANVVNAGIPFLLLPILTRVLTPGDYGVVAMFGVLVSLFGAFTGLSVHGAIAVRYFELDKSTLARYVGSCTCILFASTLVVFAATAVLGQWLSGPAGVPYEWLLVAVVISGLQFLINVRLTLWQVSRAAEKYGVFQVSQGLMNAGASLVLIFVFFMAWEGRVLGQVFAVSVFAGLAIFSLLIRKDIALPRRGEGQIENALKFGVPLIPHVIGGLVMVVADRFIIANLLGVQAVGIYTLALQFGMILGLIADAFVKVYGPWLYAKLKENTASSGLEIVGVTYIVWLGFVVLALLASIFCQLFFLEIVGGEFARSKEIVFWFFIGQAFKGMYLSVAGFFFFSSKTSSVSIITLCVGVFSILVTLVFVKYFGLKGAAMAYALSEGVLFIFAWFMSRRVCAMPWAKIIPSLSLVLKRGLVK